MTDHPSNYEQAAAEIEAVHKMTDPESGHDPTVVLSIVGHATAVAQTGAVLAVADELRALRELLAARLAVTENVTINGGDPGVSTAAVLAALREADGR